LEEDHANLINGVKVELSEARGKIEKLEKRIDGIRKTSGGSEGFEMIGEDEVKKAKEEK